MIIALASPRMASSLEDGLDKIKRFLSEASAEGAEVLCFPEAYRRGNRFARHSIRTRASSRMYRGR